MSQGSRPDRVGDLIRTELSVLLLQHVRDPGVAHVTITHVRMSKDLQQARVFYTGSDTPRHETARALRRTRPYLKRQLGQRLNLRHVPELTFEYDDSAVRQDRIARLFEEIAAEPPVESDFGTESETVGTPEGAPDTRIRT